MLASATLLTISNARAGLHVADPERPERGRDATGVAEEPEPHLVPVADELGEGVRVDDAVPPVTTTRNPVPSVDSRVQPAR